MAFDSDGSDRLLNTVGQVADVLRVWQEAVVAAVSRPDVQEMLRASSRVAHRAGAVLCAWQSAAATAVSRPEAQEIIKAAGRIARVLYVPGRTPDEFLRHCAVDLLQEMQMEVRRLQEAYVALRSDCMAGFDGAEADRREVIRQLDSHLQSLATSAEVSGVCWGCGDTSLMPSSATCERCLGMAAETMIEIHLLIEGCGGELDGGPTGPSAP